MLPRPVAGERENEREKGRKGKEREKEREGWVRGGGEFASTHSGEIYAPVFTATLYAVHTMCPKKLNPELLLVTLSNIKLFS